MVACMRADCASHQAASWLPSLIVSPDGTNFVPVQIGALACSDCKERTTVDDLTGGSSGEGWRMVVEMFYSLGKVSPNYALTTVAWDRLDDHLFMTNEEEK